MKLLRDRRTLLVPGVGDVAVGIFVDSVHALRGATSRLFERRRYKETSRYDKKANPYITKGLASATAFVDHVLKDTLLPAHVEVCREVSI
jgi:phage gp46-like protein